MKTIVANYKMHLGVRETMALVRGVLRGIRGSAIFPELIVCPSFPALTEVYKICAHSKVTLGAQNISFWEKGSLTGEVSAQQIAGAGCRYAIVGHSERRQVLGETNEDVNKKVVHAYAAKIIPIVCVGETAEERAKGSVMVVVRDELRAAFSGVHIGNNPVFIVYEPVWAIGGETPANVADVTAMHVNIRAEVANLLSVRSDKIRVLYGGSVNGEDAHAFLREPEVNGVLLGTSSMKMHEFLKVFQSAVDVMLAQGGL